uniref:Uncharacterized protein n=1 Tax=Timema genevievae TaxID=629358 RepID=A0A7R9K0T4_TIMGE|nr:unnamed protein product [Timema genevievae]
MKTSLKGQFGWQVVLVLQQGYIRPGAGSLAFPPFLTARGCRVILTMPPTTFNFLVLVLELHPLPKNKKQILFYQKPTVLLNTGSPGRYQTGSQDPVGKIILIAPVIQSGVTHQVAREG